MKTVQGNWKRESSENSNIGELIIDNEYLEFSVMNESFPFNCSFVGNDGEHNYKVYTYGTGSTKYKHINCGHGYRVRKVALSNAGFQKGLIIENIISFSFEIPELAKWLGMKSVYFNFSEEGELYAVEQKIEPIVLMNTNPFIEIKYGPASPFMSGDVDEKVEFVIKNHPRVHVTYDIPVNDEIVQNDIRIIMRFFGMMAGYVSYVQDIRLDIQGDDLKTWLYINEDFSHNLNSSGVLDRLRANYEMVKEHLNDYFENWYRFSNDELFNLPRNMYFTNNNKRNHYLEDLFTAYCKILEGYDLRVSKDEEKADILGSNILEILKTQEIQNLFSDVFTKVNSKYKPKSVSEWIRTGFLERISLTDRLKRLDKQYLNIIAGNSEFVINEVVSDNYFKAIVKTRNFLSHYKVDREGVMDSTQVYNSIGTLKCLITIIFFTHMGMEMESIKSMMIKDSGLWMFTSFLRKNEKLSS